MPLQLDATGLHTANGDSTTISTSASTLALFFQHLAIDLDDAADRHEVAAGVSGVDLRDANIDRVGIGSKRGLRKTEYPPGVALGGDEFGGLPAHIVGNTGRGRRDVLGRPVLLADQIAWSRRWAR